MTPIPWWQAARELPEWRRLRPYAIVAMWILCFGAAAQRFQHAWTEFDDPETTLAESVRPTGNHGHTTIDFGGQWLLGRMLVTGHGRHLYDRRYQWEVAWAGFPESYEPESVRARAMPRLAGEPRHYGEDARHDAENLMNWVMGHDAPEWYQFGTAVAFPFAADGICPNPFARAALVIAANQQTTPEVRESLAKPAIGGPLYPPVHAFFYAPLALDSNPASAYRTFQVVLLVVTFVAGLGASQLTRGRIWWSAATLGILLFPGYRAALDLGQNPAITLTILVWGWSCQARGRPILGGIIWGLLAFKPSWAMAFFLLPLLLRNWRFCAAMAGTGAILGAATLPFVGLQSWFDWLAVGREASATYQVNKQWIILSRDLAGIVRRPLIDFDKPDAERANPTADLASWGLLAAVVVPSIIVFVWKGTRRQSTGLGAGFIAVTAYLSCYRFMYYDALLAIFPVFVLLANPWRRTRPLVATVTTIDASPSILQSRWVGYLNSTPLTLLVGLYLVENWITRLGLEATARFGFRAYTVTDSAGETAKQIPQLMGVISVYYPWDTLMILGLWAWCGLRLAIAGSDPAEGVESGPDIG